MNQTRAGPFQKRGEWVSFPAIYFRSDRAPEVISVSASPFGFGAVTWGHEEHTVDISGRGAGGDSWDVGRAYR